MSVKYLFADSVFTVPVRSASIGRFLCAMSRAIVMDAGPQPTGSSEFGLLRKMEMVLTIANHEDQVLWRWMHCSDG